MPSDVHRSVSPICRHCIRGEREVLVVPPLSVDQLTTGGRRHHYCGAKCLTLVGSLVIVVLSVMEVRFMSVESRRASLEAAGLVHPRAEAVTAELFREGGSFFFAMDKVQVKYEMLRTVNVDAETVVAASAAYGYSRAEFYLVQAAFVARGMAGLVDERRGWRGPTKLSGEIVAFLQASGAERSGSDLAREVESRFGVSLHRRTVERARLRR